MNQVLYQVHSTDDGQFQIFEVKPVLIGTFPNPEIACTVCDLLHAASWDNGPFDDEADTSESLSESPPVQSEGSANGISGQLVENPTPVSVPPDDDTATPSSEPDYTTAFARIENGEKIATVADDIGVSLNHLRAKWAWHCKSAKPQPVTATNTIPSPAKEHCTICDREFVPSESSPDMCARCAKEML